MVSLFFGYHPHYHPMVETLMTFVIIIGSIVLLTAGFALGVILSDIFLRGAD